MNASLEKYPDYCWLDGLYDAGLFKMEQVEAVERKLKIQSSEVRLDNILMEDFKSAAEMFIYLNICPSYDWYKWFNSWRLFYHDLFNHQPLDQILLTLNRLMKSNIVEDENMDGKVRAEKLFRKLTTLTDITFEQIESMLPGPGGTKNISVIGIRGKNSFNNDGISNVIYF